MGTFAGLGIHPTIYWMSELYGNGSMDPYIRTALDHAQQIREIYSRVSQVEKAPDWLPLSVICEQCGKIGTTLATDWNGIDRRVSLQAGPRHVGHGLRPHRPCAAHVGSGEAAVQRRLGLQVEPVRHHGGGLRQGPGHGRWLARPQRCHRARGVPARAAAQRALRVPEHRRQEDEHLQGHGCHRTCHRGPVAAGAAALPVPASQAPQGHRLRPRG